MSFGFPFPVKSFKIDFAIKMDLPRRAFSVLLEKMGIIQDIPRGPTEILRVEISEFRGQNLLNIRIWYLEAQSGEFRPTQRGVALRPDQYDALKEAILKAEPEIRALQKNEKPESEENTDLT